VVKVVVFITTVLGIIPNVIIIVVVLMVFLGLLTLLEASVFWQFTT
jgi:hypothetical protein